MRIIPTGRQKTLRRKRALPIRTVGFGEAAKLPRKTRPGASVVVMRQVKLEHEAAGLLRIQHIKRAARGVAAVCQHKLLFTLCLLDECLGVTAEVGVRQRFGGGEIRGFRVQQPRFPAESLNQLDRRIFAAITNHDESPSNCSRNALMRVTI